MKSFERWQTEDGITCYNNTGTSREECDKQKLEIMDDIHQRHRSKTIEYPSSDVLTKRNHTSVPTT